MKYILSYKLRCYKRIFSPEESLKQHTWKNKIFFTCIRYPQSADDTSLAFRATRSGWWTKRKAITILNPRLFVGLCSDYSCLNTEKFRIAYSDVQTFLEGRENHYTKRKTESYVFNGFGNGISRGWGREPTTGSFATGQFCPCIWKISSVGKEKVSELEFCQLKITPIIVFVFIIHYIFFILSLKHQPTVQFLFGNCRFLYFHLLIKSPFLVIEELLCLEDKQNDGISLLVLNSTSHSFTALTRDELSSKTLEEKFLIYARPCIILYLAVRKATPWKTSI